jgi:antitoxin ParD1/3/4
MVTRNISLTPQQDAFITDLVAEGEYQNASETVRDALRALKERRRADVLKLKALRAAIKLGLDAEARGDYIEIEPHELGSLMKSLRPRRRRPRKR